MTKRYNNKNRVVEPGDLDSGYFEEILTLTKIIDNLDDIDEKRLTAARYHLVNNLRDNAYERLERLNDCFD